MAVTVKKQKIGNLDAEFVYIKDVVAYYASVHDPKKKYEKPAPDASNQSENEYAITLFMSEEDAETLMDDIKINKTIAEVGVTKNKKRKFRFPLSSQVEEGKPHYDDVKGLWGAQFTLNEFTNQGKKAELFVVGPDGKPFTDLIGNGSRVTVKLFCMRNREDLLNTRLNLVQVLEHVPYEGGTGGGDIVDDELGITIDRSEFNTAKAEKKAEASIAAELDEDDDDF